MKKIISIFLVFAMLCTAITVGAEKTDSVSEKTEILSILNILPEGFDYDKEMTRAEFVDLVIRSINKGGDTASDDIYFLVVNKNHKYYNSITKAAELGIINGTEDYTFLPDKNITFNQAVKIAVQTIGYGDIAKIKGGFSYGYTDLADRLDMLDEIKNTTDGANLAALVCNMLATPMLEIESVSDFKVKYAPSDYEHTLFKIHWNIMKSEGIVTKTSVSAFTGPDGAGKDKAEIDGEIFLKGNTNIEDYLGRKVEYFYFDNDAKGDNELVWAYPEREVKERLIAAKDIMDVDIYNGRVEYEDGNSVRTARLSLTPYVIYNGVALSAYDKTDVTPEYGSIRLMDADNDGTFEFLFVNDVNYYIVGAININDKKVYEKYSHRVLDFENEEAEIDITKNGEKIDFSKLKEYNVLSIMESKNKEKLVISVSENIITDKISGKSDERAVVNGEEYKIYKNINKPLITGEKYRLYVSIDNVIVAAESDSNQKYAYLCRAGITADDMDEIYRIKVVTQDGETEFLNLAQKLRYNGETKAAEDVSAELKAYTTGDHSRIIQYIINKDDEIKEIIHPKDNVTGMYPYDENEFTLDFTSGGNELKYLNRMFGGNQWISSDCVVWIAPEPDENGVVDSEDVSVKNSGYFHNGDSYALNLYNFNDFMAATMCEYIMDSTALKLSADKSVMLVDKVEKEIIESGDECTVVYGWKDGSYTKVPFDDNSKLSTEFVLDKITPVTDPATFERGDIIQTELKNGIVSVYRVIYNSKDGLKEQRYHSAEGAYREYPALETMMGRMENINKENIIVNVDGEKVLFFTKNAQVYIVSGNKIEKGTIYDIGASKLTGKGDKVFVHANRKNMQEIIIYK